MSASVNGGLFNGTTLSTIHTRSANRRRAAMALSRRGSLDLQELMKELNGVAPGATAAKTIGRIAHAEELGGVRTIESQELVNRATTSADVADILADILTHTSYDPTPVANGDGNPLGTR